MPSTFLDLLTVIGPCHTSLFSKPNISMMPMSPEAPLVNWKLPSRLGVDGGVITGSDAISKPLLEVSGLLPRDPFDPGELDAARNDS